MIYDMEVCDDKVCMFLATGSEQNLKPDLVMKAFLAFFKKLCPVGYFQLFENC